MESDQIRHKLSLYIDGRLSPKENEEIRKLIDSDSAWQNEHQKMVKLEQMADRFEVAGDDKYWDESKESILRKIERAESEKVIPVKRLSRRADIYKLVAVAASMALVIFISIYETDEFGQIEEFFSPQEVSKSGESMEYRAISNMTALTDSISPIKRDTLLNKFKDADKSTAVEPSPAEGISFQETVDITPATAVDQINEEITPMVPSSGESPVKIGFETTDKLLEEPSIAKPSGLDLKDGISPEISLSDDMAEPSVKKRALEKKNQVPIESTANIAIERISGTADSEFHMASPGDRPKLADSTRDYSFWKFRADSLETKFYSLMSVHYGDGVTMREGEKQAEDDKADYLEMAEAFYMTGMLAENEKERKRMITRLEKLADLADSDVALKINEYLKSLVDK